LEPSSGKQRATNTIASIRGIIHPEFILNRMVKIIFLQLSAIPNWGIPVTSNILYSIPAKMEK
jgi:hypothetical protein